MRKLIKLLFLSIAGGIIARLLICLLAMIINSPILILVFLLPGWAFGFAGRDSDHSLNGAIFGWLVMLGVNDLIYAPLIFIILWRRQKRKEQEEINSLDFETYLKKLNDGSIQIK